MKTTYTVILCVLLLAACGPAQQGVPPTAKPAADIQPEPVVPEPQLVGSGEQSGSAEPAAGTRTIEVTAKKYSFSPNPITVKQGERVKLNVAVPTGDTEHGFALPAFGVNIQVSPGETKTAEFTADKVGTFEIFCSVFCGSGHSGMKGQLIVEP